MHEFEKKIVKILNQHKSKTLDLLSSIISNVPLLITVWVVIGIFLIIRDSFIGLFVCFGLAIVFIIHFIISEGIFKWGVKKFLFERVRPYKAYPEEIRAIGKKFMDASFPSSHMASLVGGLMVLTYFYKSTFPFAVISVLVMGWSRIRNGMHYPSDILAGVVLGLFYGYLALEILKIF
ncbi:MAG TPA: phosphatase PAP2 family protein [Candidatus Moranbacteria bacterium]|nr:phosphatase PAP2 family protein [Candidatus Moranbacteria bacterium]HRZ33943.1 phosphatase PAP2 family protein [Candidatus Moranbacteria bacterium]